MRARSHRPQVRQADPAPAAPGRLPLALALSNRSVARLLQRAPVDGEALPGHGTSALDPDLDSDLDLGPRLDAMIRTESGGGRPMPSAARAPVEELSGVDLSAVRVHTDDRADHLSRAVQARAFTTGTDIFFSAGSYQPAGGTGRELIAHELTHVVQQAEAGTAGPARVSHPDAPCEVEARAVASALARRPDTDGSATSPALPHQAGNRVIARHFTGPMVVARQATGTDELAEADRYLAAGDWARAATSLVGHDAGAREPRIRRLTGAHRQYLTEGARHVGATDLIAQLDAIDHRDAVIGSVRYFAWKHQWTDAGTYLCGLDDNDIRRTATALALTFDDLTAIVATQPPPQQERLNVAFFTDPAFVRHVPHDLVGANGVKTAQAWLATDEVLGPYAAAKWGGGRPPRLTIVPSDQWGELYVAHNQGRFDPELGRTRTAEEARNRAVLVDGFTDQSTGEIWLRHGDNKPGALIHEMVHALSGAAFGETLGTAANEGTTEYFGRRVAHSAGKHPSKAYQAEHAGVAALTAVVGDQALAEAFFTGRILKLELTVDTALGEGSFHAWTQAMRADPATAPAALTAARP